MAASASESSLRVVGPPGFRLKVGDSLLSSMEGSKAVLEHLLELSPADLQGKDVAVLNLLCAPAVLGADNLNVKKCLDRLETLAAQVKQAIIRNFHRFPKDPDYGHHAPMWKMAMLVTVIKRDYGVAYNPEIIANEGAGKIMPMENSRDVFLNGVLDEDRNRRHGTCASIPVLVVAVARRLGYPVGLAVADRHVFARWDGEGCRFNVEAANPRGMTVQSDDDHRRFIHDDFRKILGLTGPAPLTTITRTTCARFHQPRSSPFS